MAWHVLLAQIPTPSPGDGGITLAFQIAAGVAVLAAAVILILGQQRARHESDKRFNEMQQVLELRHEDLERAKQRMDELDQARKELAESLNKHIEAAREAEKRIEELERLVEKGKLKDKRIESLEQELEETKAGADMWRRRFELTQEQLTDCKGEVIALKRDTNEDP